MACNRTYWVDQTSYKNHIQKGFFSKDIVNQKLNKIVTNNLLTIFKTRKKI